MPYIKKALRVLPDVEINRLLEKMQGIEPETLDGMVNYVFSRLAKGLYKGSYYSYNRIMGIMIGSLLNLYCMEIHPYELKKKAENGDI